jgi:hypothetical protein
MLNSSGWRNTPFHNLFCDQYSFSGRATEYVSSVERLLKYLLVKPVESQILINSKVLSVVYLVCRE